ncbi:MAG TPA: DUF2089 domain-containing protein [Candidatus Binataceae bacterium]|nr:DUF2089 domain-containing protein [Candidatus Binataceae bacterium]
MRPIILKCPSCQGDLTVAKIHCPKCDIALEGEFAMPALLRLAPAQLDFAEVFLKNRGVIRDVERELGVSYPTVRARLDDVIAALGYQVRPPSGDSDGIESPAARRRAILADLKAGKITPEDAMAAIGAVGEIRKPRD